MTTYNNFYGACPLPKKKWLKKTASRKSIYNTWVKINLCLWGMLIVARDKHCQWCGRTDTLTPHHIIARGSTHSCKMAWFDLTNGITLCFQCHIIKLKQSPHRYVEFIDRWLSERGLSQKSLENKFMRTTVALEDLKIIFIEEKGLCEKAGIPYTDNKTFRRLLKTIEKNQ